MDSRLYQESYLLESKHWWCIAKRELVLLLIKKYYLSQNPTILDIGCGTGKNLEVFSSIGKVFGIDSSSEALHFCRRRGLTNVTKATSIKLPFPKDSFDIVTILDVLEHTKDIHTLRETHRVLKSDSLLIVNVPAFPQLWSMWDVILHHKRRYTQKTLTDVLTHNGFKILKISYLFSFLFIPTILIRRIKSKMYTRESYPSDFQASSYFDSLLLLSRIETHFAIDFRVPFGTSLFCVAVKK